MSLALKDGILAFGLTARALVRYIGTIESHVDLGRRHARIQCDPYIDGSWDMLNAQNGAALRGLEIVVVVQRQGTIICAGFGSRYQ